MGHRPREGSHRRVGPHRGRLLSGSSQPAVVALGSNLGPRRARLEQAFGDLDALPETRLTGRSSLVETEPVGGPPGQKAYLNAAARLQTSLGPRDLLAALHELERRAGRVRRERWGPRTLDLDLIVLGNTVLDEEGCTVPHPRALERDFVLGPVAEVAGELRHPVAGTDFTTLWADFLQRHPTSALRHLGARRSASS